MNTFNQQLKKIVPAKLRPYLGSLRRKFLANPLRISGHRQKLLATTHGFDAQQVALIGEVSGRIHHRDGMYSGDGAEYLKAGLSAVACIDDVLRAFTPPEIKSVLDMPSGYGRELRFLVRRFPAATFTACDIQPGAVDFCAREFGARPVTSQPDVRAVAFETNFDLVWCGSLITHLDTTATLELLELFARHLNPSGVAIFTTNGDYVANKMLHEGATYDLPEDYIPPITASYAATGDGYHDYPRGLGYFDFHPAGRGYGVSLMSPDGRSTARRRGRRSTRSLFQSSRVG